MLKLLILLVASVAARYSNLNQSKPKLNLGWHHDDPFANSGCTCERFCNYECAINATAKPTNLTFYRMTMKGVMDLTDKNTGDVGGDTSFVLSRRNNAYYCTKNPNDYMCTQLAQFSGDDKNSTDLVLEMNVTVDGQWGPYLECNPTNVTNPLGMWECEYGPTSRPKLPPNYPEECGALNFSAFMNTTQNQTEDFLATGVTQAECCNGTLHGDHKYEAYVYTFSKKECKLYKEDGHWINTNSSDNVLGIYNPPDPNACDCKRMYEAVGKENVTVSEPQSMSQAGGSWFSHPRQGECIGAQKLGQDDCTYKVVDTAKAIKASCLYEYFDSQIESHNEPCFAACPDRHNVDSDCYLKCWTETAATLTPVQLRQPWIGAFGGACPAVTVDARQYKTKLSRTDRFLQ